ncbi:MAG TPA: serine hydrolase domain-containing protein [Roseiarcus sp.]|nr:serine hydrolase domain-containing protein [Roseiarcus sp.]
MNLHDSANRLLSDACEAGLVPGVVAMATDRDGIIYEGAFGERTLGGGEAMTVDTVGWIASMTKALTSVAAMQLVERGRLDLDAPAAKVVPDIAELKVLTGFAADGAPQLRPAKRPITLRHLLTHTSGCSYEIWNYDMGKVQAALAIPSVTECKNKALALPLVADPGERWEYGVSIDWAGKMIEAVSGLKLGQFLKVNLFDPLGMTSTAFKITPDMRSRLASTHLRGADDTLSVFRFEITQEPEFEMGGGGLYGTIGDYLQFIRMILNGGQLGPQRVLKPETVQLLGLNHMGSNRVRLLKAAIPLTNDAEFFPGVEKSWGLGFQINDAPVFTGRPAGGLMWAGLANSFFWIDPKTGVGGALLTQIFPFADKESVPLYYAFEAAVYDSLQ